MTRSDDLEYMSPKGGDPPRSSDYPLPYTKTPLHDVQTEPKYAPSIMSTTEIFLTLCLIPLLPFFLPYILYRVAKAYIKGDMNKWWEEPWGK